MSQNSRIPLSVRISQQDADFIAQLRLDDAHTPSDKIRALLTEARLRHEAEAGQDYAQVLQRTDAALTPAKHRLLVAERQWQQHSALLKLLFDALPDLQAALIADFPAMADQTALWRYEQDMIARITRLTEHILQLAITADNPCYRPDALHRALGKTLTLAALAAQQTPATPHPKKEPDHE